MGHAIRERKVRCADCHEKMRLRGRTRLQYVCPGCGASLIAAPNGKPLGVPATKETRRWRQRAHTVFDGLWRPGDITRSAAQSWLARELGIPTKACHFAYMQREMLEKVVRICDAVQDGQLSGPTSVDKNPNSSRHRRMANDAVKLLCRTGAHPIALRHWIAHHIGVDAFEDVGSLSIEECQRLVRRCDRAFSGKSKLPRGAKLDRKLKLEAFIKLRGLQSELDSHR